jgi:hypothetical protein
MSRVLSCHCVITTRALICLDLFMKFLAWIAKSCNRVFRGVAFYKAWIPGSKYSQRIHIIRSLHCVPWDFLLTIQKESTTIRSSWCPFRIMFYTCKDLCWSLTRSRIQTFEYKIWLILLRAWKVNRHCRLWMMHKGFDPVVCIHKTNHV